MQSCHVSMMHTSNYHANPVFLSLQGDSEIHTIGTSLEYISPRSFSRSRRIGTSLLSSRWHPYVSKGPCLVLWTCMAKFIYLGDTYTMCSPPGDLRLHQGWSGWRSGLAHYKYSNQLAGSSLNAPSGSSPGGLLPDYSPGATHHSLFWCLFGTMFRTHPLNRGC